jgi:hypothetical protein
VRGVCNPSSVELLAPDALVPLVHGLALLDSRGLLDAELQASASTLAQQLAAHLAGGALKPSVEALHACKWFNAGAVRKRSFSLLFFTKNAKQTVPRETLALRSPRPRIWVDHALASLPPSSSPAKHFWVESLSVCVDLMLKDQVAVFLDEADRFSLLSGTELLPYHRFIRKVCICLLLLRLAFAHGGILPAFAAGGLPGAQCRLALGESRYPQGRFEGVAFSWANG